MGGSALQRGSLVRRTWRLLRRRGLRARLRVACVERSWPEVPSNRRRRLAWEDSPLQIDDLFEVSARWSTDPIDVLHALDITAPHSIGEEFRLLRVHLEARAAGAALQYPTRFQLGLRSQELLYSLVRSARPEVVVETGIADGWSTALILAAMDANGGGELHSVDIDTKSGALVEAGHPRWHRHLTDGSAPQLATVLSDLPRLDVFLHDSDHSYGVQAAEYRLASGLLAPGGLLVSDDVNWSNAFLDHCRSLHRAPLVLADSTKLMGIIRAGAEAATVEREPE